MLAKKPEHSFGFFYFSKFEIKKRKATPFVLIYLFTK